MGLDPGRGERCSKQNSGEDGCVDGLEVNMAGTTVSVLAPVIQSAIGPVVLVSGVGLLLLSMTNRLGRVVDRARALARELRTLTDGDETAIVAQLRILARRAHLIRGAIAFGAVSVLFAAILVIVLFLVALVGGQAKWLVATIFILCMLSLIGSLIEFIRDVNLSLVAVRLEVGDTWQ
jgi:hypothetical protein